MSSIEDGQDDMAQTSSTAESPNPSWKAVGSPTPHSMAAASGRRGSLLSYSNGLDRTPTSCTMQTDHPLVRLQDYAFPPIRRNSAVSGAMPPPAPWVAVTLPTPSSSISTSSATASGGSSFFPSKEQRRTSLVGEYPDIASVPMLPEVSPEPFFREYRSMSYSVDTLDKDDFLFYRFKPQKQQHLGIMHEERDDDDDLLSAAMDEEMLAAAQLRARSKSSAAAFDIWHPTSDDSRSWRMAQLAAASRRRSSVTTTQSGYQALYPPPTTSYAPSTDRRFSLSPMPENHPLSLSMATMGNQAMQTPLDGGGPFSSLLGQRRHSLATPVVHQGVGVDALTNGLTNMSLVEQAALSPQQQPLSDLSTSFPPEKMGKGVPLDEIPEEALFYFVEFKRGRSDIYFGVHHNSLKKGDLVIVEGDRGHDLGKITLDNVARHQLSMMMIRTTQQQLSTDEDSNSNGRKKETTFIKRILRSAQPNEVTLLMNKSRDEAKALLVCQSKVKQKKLPMQVVDAEYQW